MTPKEFFDKYYKDAAASEKATGVPAVFKLAQAAIESAYGAKAVGNNFFGIKADPSWKGLTQLITTTEIHTTPNVKYPAIISITKRADGKYKYVVKDKFRAYTSAADSFNDHSQFLLKNPRYKEAFNHTDPIEFAAAVSKSGYATSPEYLSLLTKVIKMFEKML